MTPGMKLPPGATLVQDGQSPQMSLPPGAKLVSEGDTPEHPGYWQELYQQSGIPGLIKGLKEHPAETVATAIGGLFAPLNPNFTQSPQGQALKENLTRSPESRAAALTLGGLAAAPAIAKIPPVGEALDTAGTYLSSATKAAAPGLAGGAAQIAGGELLGKVPGMEWPGHGVALHGAYDVIRAFKKGNTAGKAAVAARNAPPAVEAAPAAAAEAAAAPAAAEVPKTPGQLLAESDGKIWAKLGTPTQQMYEQIARAKANTAEQSSAPQPIVSRETAPQPVAPTTAVQPGGGPIRPPLATQPAPAAATPAKVQPIRPESTTIQESPTVSNEVAPARPTAAAAAKSARYADAIGRWAKDHGMSVKDIADQWEATTPETRGQILIELKRKGYLEARETIPNTSAQGIVDALKARAQTIRPPAGFSMGEMGVR